jgi:Holliday junction resolvase RusA-like endonuclease
VTAGVLEDDHQVVESVARGEYQDGISLEDLERQRVQLRELVEIIQGL